MLAPWITTVALACLAGIAAFLGVGRAPGRARLWCVGLTLLGAAAPIAAAVTIWVEPDLVIDERLTWFRYGFYAGAGVSLALVVARYVGSRSPTRRRCPRCGYDLAGVPSLACPECERTARSERALQRSRRPRRALVAASFPLVLCTLMWASAIFSSDNWPGRLPNTALVLAAPFAPPGTYTAWEIANGRWSGGRDFSGWQRWALCRATRIRLGLFDDAENIMYATQVFIQCDARESIPTAGLLKITHDPVAEVRLRALYSVSLTRNEPSLAKARLIEIAGAKDPVDSTAAVCYIENILETVPGGVPPDAVLAMARDPAAEQYHRLQAIRALALLDPDERSRTALIAAADGHARLCPHAIAAYAALWPDDDRTRALVTRMLAIDFQPSGITLEDLANFDDHLRRIHGSLPASRLKLYSGELGRAVEARILELEAHDREYADMRPYMPVINESVARSLRRSIEEARAAHGER